MGPTYFNNLSPNSKLYLYPESRSTCAGHHETLVAVEVTKAMKANKLRANL